MQVTTIFLQLHWLPVNFRITFYVNLPHCLTYKLLPAATCCLLTVVFAHRPRITEKIIIKNSAFNDCTLSTLEVCATCWQEAMKRFKTAFQGIRGKLVQEINVDHGLWTELKDWNVLTDRQLSECRSEVCHY